jgi:hypothetical protein
VALLGARHFVASPVHFDVLVSVQVVHAPSTQIWLSPHCSSFSHPPQVCVVALQDFVDFDLHVWLT